MQDKPPQPPSPGDMPTQPATAEPPFGVNEMRLSPRQWLITLVIVLICAIAAPRLWKRYEPFPTGPDYRIPYALSTDYWLFQRRIEQISDPNQIVMLGDSVIWGEYVRPDGTLSHFLNQQTGQSSRFVNCGVNGLFPLALEGLVKDYVGSLRKKKVIVHCNLLWMSSPKADLSEEKPEKFNHSRLVPQFRPRIPSYRADAHERLSSVIEHHVGYFSWIDHLQNAYYGQHSIAQWTLQDDGRDPPSYPNAWRNPLSSLKSGIPSEPASDPQRGPSSPRHKSWDANGATPTHFEWVDLDRSLQWQAFQRVIEILRAGDNDVLVILGPFNEHMIAEDQRATYAAMRERVAGWLAQNQIPAVIPTTLPSHLYADASHPLTEGYAQLAMQLVQQDTFKNWVAKRNRNDPTGKREAPASGDKLLIAETP